MEIQNSQHRQILIVLALFLSLKGAHSSDLPEKINSKESLAQWILADNNTELYSTYSPQSTHDTLNIEAQHSSSSTDTMNQSSSINQITSADIVNQIINSLIKTNIANEPNNIISDQSTPKVSDSINPLSPDITLCLDKLSEIAKIMKDMNIKTIPNALPTQELMRQKVPNALPTQELMRQKANDTPGCVNCIIGVIKYLYDAGYHGYEMLSSLCNAGKIVCQGTYSAGVCGFNVMKKGYDISSKLYNYSKNVYKTQFRKDDKYIAVQQ